MHKPAMSKANSFPAKPSADPVARLAAFFPRVVPVDLPIQLTQVNNSQGMAETTTIEFGSSSEALFFSRLPLEFSDVVCLKSPYGGLNAHAQVVAVQYEGDRRAVAVRMLDSEKKRMS